MIKISDLYKSEYEHGRRLLEQQELINRLVASPEKPQVLDLIEKLREYQDAQICSYIFYEYVVEQLKKRGIKTI